MTLPLIKDVPGGKVYFIAKGDTYKFEGKEEQYDRSKLAFAIAGVKGKIEISKNIFDSIQDLLHEEDVQKKLKDWL
jgi:hypothetical protein